MTQAQEMLLENSLLGNVWVFLEIRFQHFGIGFVRRRDVTHFADPFDRNVSWFGLGDRKPANSVAPQETIAPGGISLA